MNKSVLKKLFSEKEQSVELSEMNIHLESIGDYEKAVDSIIDIYGRNSIRIKDKQGKQSFLEYGVLSFLCE